ERAPAVPGLFGCLVGELLDPGLDMFLLLRLRMRHVLAVGDHPRRDRRLERLALRGRDMIELLVAQPRIFFTRTGISLAVRSHRSLLRVAVFGWRIAPRCARKRSERSGKRSRRGSSRSGSMYRVKDGIGRETNSLWR